MKRLIFVLSLLSVIGMSVDSADATGRRLGRRAARNCCVVTTCCVPQTCCVVAPAPKVCCSPAATSTPVVVSAPAQPLPVTSYKPESSGCQECEASQAVLDDMTVTGSLNAPSVVQGSPQLAGGATSGQGSGMSHGQVLSQINAYLDRTNKSICELKGQIPEYGTIINNLDRSQRLQEGGVVLCYPSVDVWNSRPDIQADIIRVLTQNGVI